MGGPVTDPDILRQLNAGDSGAPRPVTDPDILRQLEGGDGGFVGEAVGKVKEYAGKAKRAITGEGRREFDLPDWQGGNLPTMSAVRIAAGLMATHDPEARADIVRKNAPEVTLTQDKFGNYMAEHEGDKGYLNRPGLTARDFIEFGGEALSYLPSARMGARVPTSGPRSMRFAERTAKAGGGAAATSIARDVAAGALGSEQGVDYPKAAIVGAAGGAFEGLSPVLVKAFRTIIGQRGTIDPVTGRLTRAGQEQARKAGIPEDKILGMDDRLAQEFATRATDAKDLPYAAGAAAMAEFNIPPTRGQAIGAEAPGGFKQIAREEQLRHDERAAGDVMRTFERERQQPAIEEAQRTVQGRLGTGGPTIASEVEGGAGVAQALVRQADLDEAGVEAAYNVAAKKNASLDMEGVRKLPGIIRGSLINREVDPGLTPATTKALKYIEQLSKPHVKKTRAGYDISPVTVRKVETTRKKLNALINASANKTDRGNVIAIKRSYDKWLDDAFDNALYSGDPQALSALKEARALRRDYAKKFESQGRRDDVGKVMEKFIADDPTPEQAVGWLFGYSKIGNARGATKIAARVKEVLGADSAEWQMMRETAWMRLSLGKNGKPLSPKLFTKNFDEASVQNPTLMRTLYSPDELSMMRRYRGAIMRTVTPDRAANPSKSGFTLERMYRQIMGRFATMATFRGEPGLALALYAGARVPGRGVGAARRAIRPMPQRPTAPGAVAVGEAGVSEFLQ